MQSPLRVAVPAELAGDVTKMEVIDVKPEALYSAYQTSIIIGIKPTERKIMQDAVYRIPDADLPCTWVGPKRGLRRYRGSDIIAYLENGRKSEG